MQGTYLPQALDKRYKSIKEARHIAEVDVNAPISNLYQKPSRIRLSPQRLLPKQRSLSNLRTARRLAGRHPRAGAEGRRFDPSTNTGSPQRKLNCEEKGAEPLD